MAFLELYQPLRHAHIGLAAASVLLFSLRGLAVLAGQRWPLQASVRRTSVAIDSLLLLAGLSLALMLQVQAAWLPLKLALLLGYIVLGSLALKRARSWRGKALALLGAWVCVALLVGVARAHQPLGWWA